MTLTDKLKTYFKRANEYEVQPGDTLSHIAQRKGLSVDAIASYNNIHPDRIRAGQRLRIPQAQVEDGSPFTNPPHSSPPEWRYDTRNDNSASPTNVSSNQQQQPSRQVQPQPTNQPRQPSGKSFSPLAPVEARGEMQPEIPFGVEDRAQLAQWMGHWEGFRSNPYRDRDSFAIGYGTSRYPDGRRVTLNDSPITREQALQYKQHYIDNMMNDLPNIVSNYSDLHPQAQAILADMRYNLGPDRLRRFVNMREAFENNDYHRAAAEVKDSAWYNQVGRRSEHHYNALRALANQLQPR